MSGPDVTGGWLLAHEAVARDAIWTAWGGDPLVLVAITAFVAAYANGVVAARGHRAIARIVARRRRFAVAGIGALLAALASPLDAAATVLFSAHMVQHLLLSAVAAPLLVLAAPVATIRRGLPGPWSSRLEAPLARLRLSPERRRWWPVPATTLAVGTMSLWHVPALYDAALASELVHGTEHATILGTGLVFWSAVLGAARRRQVLWAVAALAVASVHGGALGALLALSARPWYDGHARGAESWGVDALADQQVAGALMWVPTAAVHLTAVAVLLHGWLRRSTQADAGATRRARRVAAAGSSAP